MSWLLRKTVSLVARGVGGIAKVGSKVAVKTVDVASDAAAATVTTAAQQAANRVVPRVADVDVHPAVRGSVTAARVVTGTSAQATAAAAGAAGLAARTVGRAAGATFGSGVTRDPTVADILNATANTAEAVVDIFDATARATVKLTKSAAKATGTLTSAAFGEKAGTVVSDGLHVAVDAVEMASHVKDIKMSYLKGVTAAGTTVSAAPPDADPKAAGVSPARDEAQQHTGSLAVGEAVRPPLEGGQVPPSPPTAASSAGANQPK